MNKCIEKKSINYLKLIPDFEETLAYKITIVLEKLGVKYANGIFGESVTILYYAFCSNPNIRCTIFRHEANAGFASLGSFRSMKMRNVKYPSGLSIAFGIQGPGITNMTNPICDAKLEQIPGLFITTESDKFVNRKLQNISSKEIFKNITKELIIIDQNNVKNFATLIQKAIRKGYTEPCGPVLIIIKESCLMKKVNFIQKINPLEFKQLKYTQKNIKIIEPIIKGIELSENPLIVLGYGCVNIAPRLIEIFKELSIPYLCTLPMAQFCNWNEDICAIRMGHTATMVGNMTADKADTIVFLGSSHNEYTTIDLVNPPFYNKNKTIFNLNIDPSLYDISSYVKKNNNIKGNVEDFLYSLLYYKESLMDSKKIRIKWVEKIVSFKKKYPNQTGSLFSKKSNSQINYGDIFLSIDKQIQLYLKKNKNSNVFIVTDVGISQPMCASHISYTERVYFITEGKWGSMGAGLGNAIGCAQSNPEDKVILISGDGACFQFANDLITIKELEIDNLSIVIFDNCGYGLINEISKETEGLPLENSNGIKFYPDWKTIIEGLRIETLMALRKSDADVVCNDILKKTIAIVAIVNSEETYDPAIPKGNTKLLKNKKNKNNKITALNKCRLKEFSHNL